MGLGFRIIIPSIGILPYSLAKDIATAAHLSKTCIYLHHNEQALFFISEPRRILVFYTQVTSRYRIQSVVTDSSSRQTMQGNIFKLSV